MLFRSGYRNIRRTVADMLAAIRFRENVELVTEEQARAAWADDDLRNDIHLEELSKRPKEDEGEIEF